MHQGQEAPADILHPDLFEQGHRKLEQRTATISVIGLGYVGLPLAMEYVHAGFQVVGIDVNEARVDRLNAGDNFIQDVDDDAVAEAVAQGKLRASASFDPLDVADIVFICVPTPVTPNKDPNTSYIEAAAYEVAAHLHPGQVVILKSTTYPDTTEGLVLPILEKSAATQGLVLGTDYFLAFSPERIDPGNTRFHTGNTPVVVGGVTPRCTKIAAAIMQQVVAQVHTVSSPKVAEMEKLLENIFRSVNIALVNELARLCDRMGDISMWEVVEAAATKPFGFMSFYPGPGLGGHCIPIDPYYLSWLARRYDFETSFITLSAHVNEEMPFYVVEAVLRGIAAQPVALSEANVLLLGAAFKRDVDDSRHAPIFKVAELLFEKGVGRLQYNDPFIPELALPVKGGPLELASVPLTEAVLQDQHVVVILTDHTAYPYAHIAKHARFIVDTRHALRHVPHDQDKVWLLGGGQS